MPKPGLCEIQNVVADYHCEQSRTQIINRLGWKVPRFWKALIGTDSLNCVSNIGYR